jgi:hypothetical protein
MGGNAVAGTKRMTKAEYNQICKRICEILSRFYGYVSPIKSIDEKDSFGDVDLIVSRPTEINIVHDDKLTDYGLKKITRTATEKKIGFGRVGQRTISFVFEEKYQIDLFECENVDAGIHLTVDYRYVGMIIGHMLALFKIFFRQRRFIVKNETDAVPIVDYDDEKIVPVMLRILGLDLAKYNAGFATYKQAHEFLKKSPVFSRKWMTYNKMVLDNTSAELLKLLELINTDPEVSDEEPTIDCDIIQQIFPKTFAKFAENAEEAKRKQQIKSRFSFKLVKSWNIMNSDGSTPKPADMGKAMSSFLALPTATDFIQSDDVEKLREVFTNFFLTGSVPINSV